MSCTTQFAGRKINKAELKEYQEKFDVRKVQAVYGNDNEVLVICFFEKYTTRPEWPVWNTWGPFNDPAEETTNYAG